MKVNYGCGEAKLEGYINIDIEPSTKPNLVCDLRKQPFPYEDNSVEEIVCSHNIEHIEYIFWPQIFNEFHRVLVSDGLLFLAYPEFKVCAENFINNKQGKKDFWRATLYGRQLYPGDYHVVPVVSEDLAVMLANNHGFKNIKFCAEPNEPHNSLMKAYKDETFLKLRSQEDLIKDEVFGH